MINVTKTYLPSLEEYTEILRTAWDNNWVTNNGELVRMLESKLKQWLPVKHLLFCSNGTLALQVALKALEVSGEVITTPFSYVATSNIVLWEGCLPVFVDIRPDTLCIDAEKIEAAITEKTSAILATHVYGYPCDVEKIESIAVKYNLKVIYDAAHAFGCTYKGKSLLDFGDVSACSFHATKIFHTVEGGAVICSDETLYKKLYLYRSFGHINDDYFSVGINAKNSELHAAMGLCLLPKLPEIMQRRKLLSGLYDQHLDKNKISKPYPDFSFEYNYAYYPVVLRSASDMTRVKQVLYENGVGTRRYFYPSLNTLPYLQQRFVCEISESVSSTVLCLPLYYDLDEQDVLRICGLINQTI